MIDGESSPAADVAQLLTKGDCRLIGLMPRASNYTFLVEMTHEGRTALAVYKPRRGEAPLWDFPDGTLCQREVAAYRLSQALGWPRVPPTVLGDGPHGLGSLQLLVETDYRRHYFTLRDRHRATFQEVAAFDVVANNADRKAGHCLLGSDGGVWVVDHGVCFNVEPKLRTVIWDFAGQPVPEALRRDVHRVFVELGTEGSSFRRSMMEMLSAEEVGRTRARAGDLADAGCYPEPGSGRPFPWPAV